MFRRARIRGRRSLTVPARKVLKKDLCRGLSTLVSPTSFLRMSLVMSPLQSLLGASSGILLVSQHAIYNLVKNARSQNGVPSGWFFSRSRRMHSCSSLAARRMSFKFGWSQMRARCESESSVCMQREHFSVFSVSAIV